MAVVRMSLAAWPYAALRWPCKRIAVLAGLGCGGFYMVLTGSQVPMVRSFLMAGFVALAILVGRQAISMRSLAIAAALLMLIDPDALTGASMQMSFAAVMALIAGHEAFGRQVGRAAPQSWLAGQDCGLSARPGADQPARRHRDAAVRRPIISAACSSISRCRTCSPCR